MNVLVVALVACAAPDVPTPGPTVDGLVVEVPADGLPVTPQAANNNLATLDHEGRTWLAWRRAPSHFADPGVELHVLSRGEGEAWRHETTIALGTDVREPQLVVIGGTLRLYFAVLGGDAGDFEPQGMKMSERTEAGWSPPEDVYLPTFIPWRTRVVDGIATMIGYIGGENVYVAGGDPIEVHWLRTEDGRTWTPMIGGSAVVHRGGASEADWVWLPSGGVLAVMRNEAGQDGAFGSRICTSPGASPAAWDCVDDPRKFDSPLLFEEGGRYWLVARRTLGHGGRYDLGDDGLSHAEAYFAYQIAYWQEPKRCALWEVDPQTRSVAWVLDLPSSGDTCFPDHIDRGGGRHEVWNYTSPLEGPDLSWVEAQHGPTSIGRVTLDLSGA